MNAWWLRPAARKVTSSAGTPTSSADVADGVLHRVAQPDDLRRRRARVDEPAEHRHRVRVVEEPRRGAEVGHLVPSASMWSARSQRPEDAADAERVGDRLPKPEAGRDLEVEQRGRVTADLNHVQDVVGTLERRAPVEVRADRRRSAALAGDIAPPSPRRSRAGRGRCRAARSRRRRARGSRGCPRSGSS